METGTGGEIVAEFTKVAHEWVRMCKAYSDAGDCIKCPMVTNPICGCMSDDNGASDKEISKAEADIMSWAAEHLEPQYPTWMEWLHDLGLIVRREGTFTEYGPNEVFSAIKKVDILTIKGYQSIPADIAQKLGIEPKEG